MTSSPSTATNSPGRPPHQPRDGAAGPQAAAPAAVRDAPVPDVAGPTPPGPTFIGKYKILRKLGAGAMGEVWLCLQPELDRPVAVKLMRQSIGQTARFQREARSAAQLVHPHVVRVYDVGVEGEVPYIVMEYVEGQPLSGLVGSDYLTLPESLRILYHVAEALAAAHELGIIHRDIKPSNILVDTQGRPKLADFGLAKSLVNDPTLSGTGELIGTPRYMSPEQVLAETDAIDHRSDLFSLGVVMYEMLSGRPPFDGPHVMAVLKQLTDSDPDDLAQVDQRIPASVATLCTRALAKRPEDRIATARAFADALRDILAGDGPLPLTTARFKQDQLIAAFRPLPLATASQGIHDLPQTPHRRKSLVAAGLAISGLLVLGLVITGTALLGPVIFPQPPAPEDDPASAEFDARLDAALATVNESVTGPLKVPETQTPRDVLRDRLDDVTAILKRRPDDTTARLLKAKLLRRGGEMLAASTECTALLQLDPGELEPTVERLLARAQLYLVYLGAWDDPSLRSLPDSLFEVDLATLRASNQPLAVYLASLVSALLSQSTEAEAIEALVKSRPPLTGTLVSISDLALLEVDLLSRAAENASAEIDREAGEKDSEFDRLARYAQRGLRQGLDADPQHVGLLFLKALSFQRRIGWDDGEGADRDATLRRTLPQYEATIDRLLRVNLRQGCDASIARAVLAANLGETDRVADYLREALASKPTVPSLAAARAWYLLYSPPDGVHSPESLDPILKQLEQAVEQAPDEHQAWFVQALAQVVAGRWDDARRSLRQCRQRLPADYWPEIDDQHALWLASSDGPYTRYLDRTRNILDSVPTRFETRQALHTELLTRLADSEITTSEQLSEDDVRSLTAGTHFTLAVQFAQEDRRGEALAEIRAALAVRSPDIVPDSFRSHGAFGGWNEDPEFLALYAEFQPPTDEPPPILFEPDPP